MEVGCSLETKVSDLEKQRERFVVENCIPELHAIFHLRPHCLYRGIIGFVVLFSGLSLIMMSIEFAFSLLQLTGLTLPLWYLLCLQDLFYSQ